MTLYHKNIIKYYIGGGVKFTLFSNITKKLTTLVECCATNVHSARAFFVLT